ncbi:MAG: hypothetical protein R3C59_13200 [Planctomycetaceae bacterium]
MSGRGLRGIVEVGDDGGGIGLAMLVPAMPHHAERDGYVAVIAPRDEPRSADVFLTIRR